MKNGEIDKRERIEIHSKKEIEWRYVEQRVKIMVSKIQKFYDAILKICRTEDIKQFLGVFQLFGKVFSYIYFFKNTKRYIGKHTSTVLFYYASVSYFNKFSPNTF